MVGTKQELIERLMHDQSIQDDDVIMLDVWTWEDINDRSVTPLTNEQIAEVMVCVEKDIRNESTYATIDFAIKTIKL